MNSVREAREGENRVCQVKDECRRLSKEGKGRREGLKKNKSGKMI